MSSMYLLNIHCRTINIILKHDRNFATLILSACGEIDLPDISTEKTIYETDVIVCSIFREKEYRSSQPYRES